MKNRVRVLSNKQVLKNLLIVSVITLLTSGLGFIKEATVAAYYGLSLSLDTFFVAILIPGLLNTVFLGSYKSVFIPNYINEIHIKGNLGNFQSTSFALTFIVSFIFIIIAILGTDVYLDLLFPNKSYEYYYLVKKQFYILLPAVTFWGLSSICAALLNINNEYRLSSLSGIFTPLIILTLLFCFRSFFKDTLLAWGTTLGSVISFVYLIIIARKKGVIQLGILEFRNSSMIITIKQLPAKIASALLTALNGIVDQFFAAQLILGSIAALNYGIKIPAFLGGLLLAGVSNVLLPYFTKSILSNKIEAFNILFKNIKVVFLSLLIVATLGILFSDLIVNILFQRKEFTSEDAETVSAIQKIFLVYLPFQIVDMMMVNFCTSLNKNAIMAYFSFIAVILNVIFDYLLMQEYGIFGIAICTTIIIIFKTIGMYLYLSTLRRKLNPLKTT